MKLCKNIKDFAFWLYNSHRLRLKFSLIGGILLNLFYIIGNIASTFLYGSIWSATLTVYHLTLVVIRLYLLSARGGSGRENNSAIICLRVGILLLFLDLSAAVMMIYALRMSNFVRYSGVILLGFIGYSAYSFFTSLRVMRREENRAGVQFVAKNITLSTSLMSVFNLQYSFLSLVGASLKIIGRLIFLGGVVVFFVILVMSVRLIRMGIRSSKI